MTDEIPTGTEEAVALPGGVINEETWDAFADITTAALGYMVEGGEIPAFLGQPMTKDEAINHLKGWLQIHKDTLVEGGVEFLRSLVNGFALVDEPQQSIEEFEAGLASLSAEQLVVLSEQLADRAETLKQDVVDRRRLLVADGLALGNVLLRGALATGLTAALSRV
jgi:hypothetical protein